MRGAPSGVICSSYAMKTFISLLLLLFLVSCGGREKASDMDLEDLYALLDAEIARSSEYERMKEARIEKLRIKLAAATDDDEMTELTSSLVKEYEAFNADSALYYVMLNLDRPYVRKRPELHMSMLIRKADVLAHAGLFTDALEIMQSIPRESLSDDQLEGYYATYCATYQYLSEYTNEHETGRAYEQLRAQYSDSLENVAQTGSFNHQVYVMAELARDGKPEEAIEALTEFLDRYKSGMREYSIVASTLSYIHKTTGNADDYKRYLVLSAISDVRGAVKENMSFREVATVMFEDGDVDRANRYLKKSFADANFYSALMRNVQSAKMLPVIDEAYSIRQDELTGRLRGLVLLSGVLSIILIVTILLILKQFRSLRRANSRVRSANEELMKMSEELTQANADLASRNAELHEYNRTKEQYAGLFMEYCSTAISTLQHYQQSLRVMVAQGGNRAGLLRKLETSEISDQLLRNFYKRFDEAILSIYPSFVEKFNSLLRPDEQIVLKSGELLNTELRLFALIRLGIDDSAKLAEFLRCSISTVYTYRSKMRRRALDPGTFEDSVRNMV